MRGDLPGRRQSPVAVGTRRRRIRSSERRRCGADRLRHPHRPILRSRPPICPVSGDLQAGTWLESLSAWPADRRVEPHEPEDAAVGEALCPDCYDWENAVIFNARVGALWHHTVIGVNRQLANAAGIRVRMFARSWRLSFAKVVEFQARGVVHVHALIRLDHLDESPTVLDASDLVSAFAAAAARVTVQNPLNPGWRVRWGTQTDLQPIPPERRRVAAAYRAKYATKSVDGAGLLDHRLTSNHHLEQLDLPEQLRRMAAVAWELGGRPDLQDLNLRAWAHCLGYRGHWLTKSRYWSTTFTELRARRQAWRLDQLGIDPDDRHRWVGEWSYQGVGHLTAGDAWLAGSAAAGRELNRRIAWEER